MKRKIFISFIICVLLIYFVHLINFYMSKQLVREPYLETEFIIPKRVYQTSIDIPKEVQEIINHNKSLNPEYDFIHYNDDECLSFVKENYPEYLDAYNSVKPGAFKADLWRLMVLYKYGGFYNDIPHKYIVPFREFILPHKPLLVVIDTDDIGIHNAFLGAVAGNEIIKMFLSDIVENIRNRNYGVNSLDITGPTALGYSLCRRLDTKMGELEYKCQEIAQVLKHSPGIIIDKYNTNTTIIHTKFDGYTDIMYTQKNKDHYDKMWQEQNVFV